MAKYITSLRDVECMSRAIEASSYGDHDINNVGCCIGHRGRPISTGWNTGDRTRVRGTFGHKDRTLRKECKNCASVHAEVAAWMKLPRSYKSMSKKTHTVKRYREKEHPRYLYCKTDSFRYPKGGQALRRMSIFPSSDRSI